MENGKGTTRETELLGAEDVAGLVGVKETTVYKWCKEGKLPCLKVGKRWRIRREALEDFLKSSERRVTLGPGGWAPSCGCRTACWPSPRTWTSCTAWTPPSSGWARRGVGCW